MPDGIAAAGLDAALLPGPFVAVAPADRPARIAAFRSGRVALSCEGAAVARGAAANAPGTGPLDAHPGLPRPEGGIPTTGTMTYAFPVAAGQIRSTARAGLPVPGPALRLA